MEDEMNDQKTISEMKSYLMTTVSTAASLRQEAKKAMQLIKELEKRVNGLPHTADLSFLPKLELLTATIGLDALKQAAQ